MNKFTEDRIKDVAAQNIVAVIGDYLDLKRSGKDFTALCPFHDDEHDGTFKVSPSKGVWKCFGCGKGGDVAKFIQEIEGVDYPTALNKLAARFGIDTDSNIPYTPIKIAPRASAPKEICYIPEEVMAGYESTDSILVGFLKNFINPDIVESVCSTYHIGATKDKWTIYPQIDKTGRVRYMKKMQYLNNGHRNKENRCSIYGMHSDFKKEGILKEDWCPTECLFGEHLLSYQENNDKVIGIVESEKSAIICAMLKPQLLWLATGGKSKITDALKILAGRRVLLYPDVDGFDEWKKAAEELKTNCSGFSALVCSRWVDNLTDEQKRSKMDIADLLLKEEEQRREILEEQLAVERIKNGEATFNFFDPCLMNWK